MTGFEMAGRIWSSYLTDNTTLNLYVGVSSSLPGNVIGGALPGVRASQSYASIRAALRSDITSLDDQTAVNNLWIGNNFQARFDMYNLFGFNIGDSAASQTINLTRANAKALGINLSDDATALDGYILFGSLAGSSVTWNYDYTRSGSPAANSLDFLSTAIHEIGHVLGFVSGIDKPGWLNSQVVTLSDQLSYTANLDQRITYATTLDLFRYSNNTLYLDQNDLSYGSRSGSKYFSLDGRTAIAQFSTGADTSLGGDGYQASHWKVQSSPIGVMSPTLTTGQRSSISATDLRVLDAIGWNLSSGGINTKIDLSALQSQSKQALAGRLNQTTSWLDANVTTAAQNLAQNRDQDVYTMVQNSQIYGLSRTTPPGSSPTYSLVIQNLMHEEALFETLDELTILSPNVDAPLSSDVNTNALSNYIQRQAVSNIHPSWAVELSQSILKWQAEHGMQNDQSRSYGFTNREDDAQPFQFNAVQKPSNEYPPLTHHQAHNPVLKEVGSSNSAHETVSFENTVLFLGSSNQGLWRDDRGDENWSQHYASNRFENSKMLLNYFNFSV